MKRTIGLIMATCALAGIAFAQSSTRTEVEALLTRWCDACHRKDMKPIADSLDASFQNILHDGKSEDRATFLKEFAKGMAGWGDMQITWGIDNLVETKDEVTVWSHYAITHRLKDKGKWIMVKGTGHEVDVLKRTASGWKMTYTWEYDWKGG